jgi:6-phosphogluconolactonase
MESKKIKHLRTCGKERGLFVCLLIASLIAVDFPQALAQDAQAKKAKAKMDTTDTIPVWLGTGKGNDSKGIYLAKLNVKTGKLSPSTLAAEAGGPGFLAMHPTKPVLYAVADLGQKPVVAAYAVATATSGPLLKLLNAVEIGDGGASHVSVDSTGRILLTAQYGAGSVAVFSLNEDGSVRERTQLIKHQGGSKVVADRQNAPHAHWTGFSPDNRFAFVPDLGLDKVVIYRLDTTNASLEPHGHGIVPPGSGPRHMKFHNNGNFIFVLNELALTITVFAYDAQAGTMTPLETVPTVSEQQKAKEQFFSASEIRVHPTGKFIYSANRGHDTISVFAFDEGTGRLSFIEHEHVRGATPRNFNIDPSGKWLLAAGQDSHTLAAFAIDAANGEMTYNRSVIHTPAPICVLFGHE